MIGRPILTAAEMREAEGRAVAAGTPIEILMERAGFAAAEAIRRFAGPVPALILCGPGNNGGDGYVIARALAERGIEVQVAALGEPVSPAARAARERWGGVSTPLGEAAPAPLLVDALFGTGLTRPLDEQIAAALARLGAAARIRVAIDLPSGAATDDGALLSPVPDYDLTISFATLKPSHLLQPAARHMGRIVVADIGIDVAALSRLSEIAMPQLRPPGPADHKYTRGYVAVHGDSMPGAAALAACAALRSGAGYVRLFGDPVSSLPLAIVQGEASRAEAHDERIGVNLIGPGLEVTDANFTYLDEILRGPAPSVLDGGALSLIAEKGAHCLLNAATMPIITPHEGEFRRLFGAVAGSKVDRARAAAAVSGSIVLYKGADTIVASPDGRASIAARAPYWLASAGTGDVLAGIVAAMRAGGMEPFEAACAGVWLHARAARLAGPALIADDLLAQLPAAIAACL